MLSNSGQIHPSPRLLVTLPERNGLPGVGTATRNSPARPAPTAVKDLKDGGRRSKSLGQGCSGTMGETYHDTILTLPCLFHLNAILSADI